MVYPTLAECNEEERPEERGTPPSGLSLVISERSSLYQPRNPAESIHYGVVAGHLESFLDRQRKLERLCRYACRPPVATERVSLLEDGRLLYRLKRRWRDGTSHVIYEPLEMVEKLAALVPPPPPGGR